MEYDARMHIGNCLFYGDASLAEFVSYAQKMLGTSGPKVHGRSLQGLHGQAYAKLGEFETARKLIAERLAAQESFGNQFVAAFARAELAAVEMLAGDPASAERELRRAYETLENAGDTGFRSTIAAQLADAICVQGRFDEARQYTQISEEIAAPDDYVSQILWRSVRAKAIASQGRLGEGEKLAREALSLAQDTDNIDLRGDALMALAEVLVLAERAEESILVIREALALYGQKGNVVSANTAEALLGELRTPSES